MRDKFEIAQHGYDHSVADANISLENLIKGKELIINKLGIIPITYIPPYHNITQEAMDNLKGEYYFESGDSFKISSSLIEIGINAQIFDYSKNSSLVSAVFEKCNDSLKKNKLCVILIHPTEFKENELDEFLDEIIKQNLSTTTFKQQFQEELK